MTTPVSLTCVTLLASVATTVAAPLEIFVSSPPQQTIVERVGGPHVNVSALIGAGQDPHHFNITPAKAVALKKAKAYFATGLPFELSQLDKISSASKDLELVNIARGIELQELGEHDHGGHDDHEGHDHHAHAEDPHIWLSPPLLKTQAKTVCDILSKLDPDHAADFEKNHTAFA
ncbi:MAG: metal ABC transporter substrate-binding protein, partial [Verrucomicrobiales bacterium]|nr:metal ABC transporter substrate-binding protein [Verrucomicrobiales bacterium]